MALALLPLTAADYRSHPLHARDGEWAETNCATDMWIEVLYAWGLDPVAGLGFTVGTDFDGEQWTMFTYPEEDLRTLYGIDVHELNVWRPTVEHAEHQLALGHAFFFDVDAFYLPDTAGTTYRRTHQKTTIAVQMLDRPGRTLGYFHNAGYAELAGDDFDGIFHLGDHADPLSAALPPFAATARFKDAPLEPDQLVEAARRRLVVHLARRPPDNPVTRLTARMVEDAASIAAAGMDAFHRYAFGTCRQLGANGALAAAFVEWLACHDAHADPATLAEATDCYRQLAATAKSAEFTLARAAAGRRADLPAAMAPAQVAWARATSLLEGCYCAGTPRR